MNASFFGSDLFRFGSTLLGIIISSWVIIGQLGERTPGTPAPRGFVYRTPQLWTGRSWHKSIKRPWIQG